MSNIPTPAAFAGQTKPSAPAKKVVERKAPPEHLTSRVQDRIPGDTAAALRSIR